MAADYYALLGVERNVTESDLKRAYRKLARELHPDANPNNADAEARFKEVTQAYETLSDPALRQRYDTYGSDDGSGPFAGFGSAGFGDLFDAFFGGAQQRRGPSGPPRGNDMELGIELDLDEVVAGSNRDVKFKVPVRCDTCDGSGAAQGTAPVTCATCAGAGQVQRIRQTLLGQVVTSSQCPACGGTGSTVSRACESCRGEGRRTQEVTHTITVPAGVDDGLTLRLTGKGAAGPRGGEAGDLFLHIRVRPHDRFTRHGADLLYELHVPMTQAALGADLPIDTFDGEQTVTVPPGSQTGRTFRFRHLGVPQLNGRGRGDILAQLVVDTPDELTEDQDRLLRTFAEQRGESVAPPDDGFIGKIRSAFK